MEYYQDLAQFWYDSYIVVARKIKQLSNQQNEFQLISKKYEKYHLEAFNFCERSGEQMYEFKTKYMQKYGFAITSNAVDFFLNKIKP